VLTVLEIVFVFIVAACPICWNVCRVTADHQAPAETGHSYSVTKFREDTI